MFFQLPAMLLAQGFKKFTRPTIMQGPTPAWAMIGSVNIDFKPRLSPGATGERWRRYPFNDFFGDFPVTQGFAVIIKNTAQAGINLTAPQPPLRRLFSCVASSTLPCTLTTHSSVSKALQIDLINASIGLSQKFIQALQFIPTP